MEELIEDMENMEDNIGKQAAQHLHPKDVILTFGSSGTVEGFLARAFEQIPFSVVVCDGGPSKSGAVAAERLA